MKILGIDPGTAITGYGIIRKPKTKRGKIETIEFGCINTTPDYSPQDRLKILHNELNQIIKKHQPEVMVVESLFFFKNLKTVMPVSQARGVILLSAAKGKIPVFEFSPPQIKKIIADHGRADKKDVQKRVQSLLELAELPKQDDAADALGVALCYLFEHEGILPNTKIT